MVLDTHTNFNLQLGMRNYHLRRNSKWCPSLNLDKLWTLVSEQTRLKYKDHPEGKAPVIDIIKAVILEILIFSFFCDSQIDLFYFNSINIAT